MIAATATNAKRRARAAAVLEMVFVDCRLEPPRRARALKCAEARQLLLEAPAGCVSDCESCRSEDAHAESLASVISLHSEALPSRADACEDASVCEPRAALRGDDSLPVEAMTTMASTDGGVSPLSRCLCVFLGGLPAC